MGFFGWLTGGIPNRENLAWVAADPYRGRFLGGEGWFGRPRIALEGRPAREILYYSWSSGSGKSRTSHYRTFFVAPLAYSHGTLLMSARGCNLFGRKRPHDFKGFTIETTVEAMARELVPELRRVAANLRPARVEIAPHGFFVQANRFLVRREDLGPFIENAQFLYAHAQRAKEQDRTAQVAMLEKMGLPRNPRVATTTPFVLTFDAPTGPARIELKLGYKPRVYRLPPEEHKRWTLPNGTSFSAPLESSRTLKIFPQRFWHAVPKLFGYQDVHIGDDAFDREFVVKSNQQGFAREFVGRDMRTVLTRLRALGGGAFLMDLTLRSLIIRKDACLQKEEELRAFSEGCLAVLERFATVAGISRGVEMESVKVDAAGGICQVCGTQMEEQVRCARCDTPHHRECWEYMGACSTFACGETRAVAS